MANTAIQTAEAKTIPATPQIPKSAQIMAAAKAPSPSVAPKGPNRSPTPDEIRARAYQKFCARNGGPGSAEVDWLEAERELRDGQTHNASPSELKREKAFLSASESGKKCDPVC